MGKVYVLIDKYDAYGDKWETIIGVYTNKDRAEYELATRLYERKKYERYESDYELEEHTLIKQP